MTLESARRQSVISEVDDGFSQNPTIKYKNSEGDAREMDDDESEASSNSEEGKLLAIVRRYSILPNLTMLLLSRQNVRNFMATMLTTISATKRCFERWIYCMLERSTSMRKRKK